MVTYWWYILKASICLIVFYCFYILVLRNSTFFLLNRVYLVAGLLLSFIIPVLRFSIFEGQSSAALPTFLLSAVFEPEFDYLQPKDVSNAGLINFATIITVTYFSGILVLFLRLLFSIIRIIRIRNNSESNSIGRVKIVLMKSGVPFSFFNSIFLPKDEETNLMIIEHEMAHSRQFHWFDILLTEIAFVLLWFNPFVVLYKNSLRLQHEYLADSDAVRTGSQTEEYLSCMLKRVQVVSSGGLISQFYCKTIKKRIVMITKNKTSINYLGVYLLIIPIICLLFLAFSTGNKSKSASTSPSIVKGEDVYRPSIYPVDFKKVTKTSEYGNRLNPISGQMDFHYGIDFAMNEEEKIVSTAKGIVAETSFDVKKGNFILIKHNEIYSTFYSHLKSATVKTGENIEKGQLIGYVGNTGTYSTGSHLHYEVYENGERVNPKDYLPE